MTKKKKPEDLLPKGRPTIYCSELVDDICRRLSEGEPLIKICLDDHMPEKKSIYTWLQKYPDFLHKYQEARRDQADSLADEIVYIADTEEDSSKAKNRIHAREWTAAKLRPKRYGDSKNINVSGTLSFDHLSENQILDRMKQLAERAGYALLPKDSVMDAEIDEGLQG